ncbi:MAG: electron transfer flavoprotein subunit alpha/FixB family protein [Gemmatimonadota bacterium]
MADVLAVAEVRDGVLRTVSKEVVSTARQMADRWGGSVHALLLGPPGVAESGGELASCGADRIFVAEEDAFARYHPDAAVRAVHELEARGGYAAVLFPASAQGKDLSPRVATRLDRGLATDVTDWEIEDGRLIVARPMYAGKAFAKVGFPAAPALASLRPNVFPVVETAGAGELETIEVAAEPARQRVRGIESGERDALDVGEAAIVVSGGRGMQDADNWKLLEELVDALGDEAALGASRAVVDAGWRPHAEQVGQTGKTVAPNLYFAIGISGAIQHLAGMRTAKVIVAVNKDPDAPIFGVADYGIVGDLFAVVPRLAEEIRKVRSTG